MSLSVTSRNPFVASRVTEAKIEFDTAVLLIGETLALYEACPSLRSLSPLYGETRYQIRR